MRKFLEILGLLVLLVGAVFLAKELNAKAAPQKPETTTPAAAPTAPSADLTALIAKEFGPDYKLATDIAPIYGDFDRDGKQDLAVVATGGNPLMGEGLFNYKTLDPYNASFGYGNPKVTMAFNTHDTAPRFVLIIHSWQAPIRKFVLVNLPFEKLRIGHMMIKKKPTDALESVDNTGVQGAVYFDGKKYKWEIIGSELDH
jgi:hypothetical protein